jgi:hypothetical protein
MLPIHMLASLALLLAAVPALGESSIATLKWTHQNPSEVVGYKVFFGTAPGVYDPARTLAVGLPGSSGVYAWAVSVEAGTSVYAAVTAVNAAGAESDFSAWKRFDFDPALVPLGSPGLPFIVEP